MKIDVSYNGIQLSVWFVIMSMQLAYYKPNTQLYATVTDINLHSLQVTQTQLYQIAICQSIILEHPEQNINNKIMERQ